MANWNAIAQGITLDTATRRGDHWTQADLDKVRALDEKGVKDADIAIAMGRTLYAIWNVLNIDTERRAIASRRRVVVLPADRGFTSLADMGF